MAGHRPRGRPGPAVLPHSPAGGHEERHVGFSRDGLRRLKRGLEKAGLDPRYFAWPPPADAGWSPYRGLKALDEVDTNIFFGRDAAILDRLDITLDAPGLTVEDAWECVVWRGKPLVCTFALSVPDDISVIKAMLGIRVYHQAVPVGRLAFSITVAPEAAAAPFAAAGEAARRYRRAFLSYASSDRPEVVKRAQALRAGRIEFFADVLSLEPSQQ